MMGTERPVRTRVAPSPTGEPHVGTAYVCLFNRTFARQHNGQFILRIEDTDQTRSRKDYEEALFESLRWLGLDWDEGPDIGGPFAPYRQSERRELYQRYAHELVGKGKAYCCFCTPEQLAELRRKERELKKNLRDEGCRNRPKEEVDRLVAEGLPHTIRMRVDPSGRTEFADLLRGVITFENDNVTDQIILKSDGFPTYHLAAVVDDHLMELSHIIRAEEWISSVPKHIMLYEWLGWEPPVFCHLPLLRNQDGSKMSKRKSVVSLRSYRNRGYLPEALLNFLALQGWASRDETEFFDQDFFEKEFRLEDVSPGGPRFDFEKFDWLNGRHLRALPVEDFRRRLTEWQLHNLELLLPMVQQRVKRLDEFADHIAFLRSEEVALSPEDLTLKKRDRSEAAGALERAREAFAQLREWRHEAMEAGSRELCAELGWKPRELFMLMRVAVTGSKQSLPLFESMEALGRSRCLTRLQKARDLLATP